MFNVNFSRDLARFQRTLNDVGKKQYPFAAAVALTKTAQDVHAAEKASMQDVFDRPTKFALNSLFVKPATKSRLFAHVFFREFAAKGTPAVKFLGPQVFGGKRRIKRAEKALQHAGLLPQGKAAVPGKSVKLDQYGNMRPGQITRILSALRASSDATQNRSGKTRTPYFVGAPGGAPEGVWRRIGRRGKRIEPVMIFIDVPSYEKRLPFHETAVKVSRANFPSHFKTSFEGAMRTAR